MLTAETARLACETSADVFTPDGCAMVVASVDTHAQTVTGCRSDGLEVTHPWAEVTPGRTLRTLQAKRPNRMVFTFPVTVEIHVSEWADEYGVDDPARATEDVRKVVSYAHYRDTMADAIKAAWPILGDKDVCRLSIGEPVESEH